MTTLREAWAREGKRFPEPEIPTALESARDRLDAAIVAQAQAFTAWQEAERVREAARVALGAADEEHDTAQRAYRHALLAAETS